MRRDDYFLIAKIVSVVGKEGLVKINSFSDFPERFFRLEKVYIDFFDDMKEFFVEGVKKEKNSFFIKFRNFDSEYDSAVLVGKEIFVDSENAVKLPDDQFFIHDLIGSAVYRNGSLFGIIKDVLSYPANDVYVIESEGREILIPAAKDFIESFDADKKMLILKPGEDFYEDDES